MNIVTISNHSVVIDIDEYNDLKQKVKLLEDVLNDKDDLCLSDINKFRRDALATGKTIISVHECTKKIIQYGQNGEKIQKNTYFNIESISNEFIEYVSDELCNDMVESLVQNYNLYDSLKRNIQYKLEKQYGTPLDFINKIIDEPMKSIIHKLTYPNKNVIKYTYNTKKISDAIKKVFKRHNNE